MSSTLCFPIKYILSLDSEGEQVLHPAISIDYILLASRDGVHLAPYWGIDVDGDGGKYELYICNNVKDDYYQDSVTFSGFHDTALRIIDTLRIPKSDYQLF